MLIDTHAHFDMIFEKHEFSEESLMQSMKENGVLHSVQVSIEPEGFQWSLDFARRNEGSGVLFTIGMHPSTAAGPESFTVLSDFTEKVMTSGDRRLLFAIGECGLDFYRMRQKRELQEESFRRQLIEAKKWAIPVVVHSRDAMEETLAVIKESSIENGVMHCFSGGSKAAQKVLDLGFHISFAGNVTYNGAGELHDSARYVPLDRILVETDAPFLTPVPLRGKQNRPEYIKNTYTFIAGLKKIPVEKLAASVQENFLRLKNR